MAVGEGRGGAAAGSSLQFLIFIGKTTRGGRIKRVTAVIKGNTAKHMEQLCELGGQFPVTSRNKYTYNIYNKPRCA